MERAQKLDLFPALPPAACPCVLAGVSHAPGQVHVFRNDLDALKTRVHGQTKRPCNHLEVARRKHFATPLIFISILDVWKSWPSWTCINYLCSSYRRKTIKGLKKKIICSIQDITLALASGNGSGRKKRRENCLLSVVL